jgi:hypothetical protein
MPFDNPAIGMTNEQIMKVAPSVFATGPAPDVSEKYSYLPTYTVLDQLRSGGMVVASARQGFVKAVSGRAYAIHELRFQKAGSDIANRTKELGMLTPELILRNSHNRTSGFGLQSGFRRLICMNGATVVDASLGVRLRHYRCDPSRATDAAFEIIENFGRVVDKAASWQKVMLTGDQRVALARKAVEIRGTSLAIEPGEMLAARRSMDERDDLWSTFNVLQENLTNGGTEGRNAKNGVRRLRGIKSLAVDADMNRKLWTAAAEFATAVA